MHSIVGCLGLSSLKPKAYDLLRFTACEIWLNFVRSNTILRECSNVLNCCCEMHAWVGIFSVILHKTGGPWIADFGNSIFHDQ